MNENLRKIFELANIKHILYVDDEFSNYANYKDVSNARCHVLFDNQAELPFVCDSSTMDEKFDNWWDSAPQEDIWRFISKHGINKAITDVDRNLEDLCAEEIDRKNLSPEQFIEQLSIIKSSIPEEENILFLIDKELNGDIESSKIIELIRPLNNKYIALFSGTFQPQEEIATWANQEYPEDVYPLSKSRLDNASLIEGIRNVIWLRSISTLKTRTIDVLKESFSAVAKQLDAIDPVSFDKIVMDVSIKEGCWEFETLYRVVMSMLEQAVQNYMVSNENFTTFQEITHAVRKVKDALPNVQNTPINTEQILSMQKSEWYYDGVYLNTVYSPIGNGDIFSIESDEMMQDYILLCQPCTLSIRPEGRRKEGVDYAYIVPIKQQKKPLEYWEKINSNKTGKETKFADFTSCKRISLDVLDLVSFNAEGKAVIDLSNMEFQDSRREFLQKNMILRYGSIWNKINNYYKTYVAIRRSNIKEEEKEACLAYFERPYEMCTASLLKTPIYSTVDKTIEFSIRRKCRYKEPYVQDLLQKFMRYLSRPGFAPQFNRF